MTHRYDIQPGTFDGYWVFPADGVLSHGDGREVAQGVVHEVTGVDITDPEIGEGLFACVDLDSAMTYLRPKTTLWMVRLGPGYVRFGHKVRSNRREYVHALIMCGDQPFREG